jgi:hypothetical protein
VHLLIAFLGGLVGGVVSATVDRRVRLARLRARARVALAAPSAPHTDEAAS